MFSVHTTPVESPAIWGLCLTKTRSGKSRDYCDVIVCEKFRSQNVFRPDKNEKPGDVFRFRFRDGLVWMVGLIVEIKLRFQISPV